jgi:hypothetical protein
MTQTRLAILGSLAVALVVAGVIPARADDDLSDYLEDADAATYSGRRLVGTNWDGIEKMSVMDVQHTDGLTMVGPSSDFAMMGHGRFREGSSGVAIDYDALSDAVVSHTYSLTRSGTQLRAGRPVHVIDIYEGTLLRMKMTVDTATGAPLETEVFDGDGDLFRYSTMVEFSPMIDEMAGYVDDGDYAMLLPLDEAQLPAQIWRYELIDAYSAQGEAEQGFYSDGLFQHSLFTIPGPIDLESMTRDGETWTVEGFDYLRVVTPVEVWVLWNTPDTTYALVGDLPPDHLSEVLAALPRPGQRNWFARLWEKLFG